MNKLIPTFFLITSLVAPLRAANVELGDPALSIDPETPSTLAVSLKNATTAIVGMQFDIVYASALASPGIPTLPEGTNHEIDVRLVEEGKYRVMVFSPTNADLPAPYTVDLRFGFAEEAPDGGPAMRIENLILAGSDGSSIAGSPTYGPIGGWRNEKFSEEVWNNKTTGGDTGDADKDGLKNIEEFYFDTDPRSSESNATSVVQGALASDGTGGKVLRLTWTGKKAAGVKAVVYGGTDPANLTDEIAEQVVNGTASDVNLLKAEKDVKDAKAYFMEIRVERE
jgi:hypothetical protein